jgi:hypothetical protein
MNGCVDGAPQLLSLSLDETVEALAPAAQGLLQRVAPGETVASESSDLGYRFVTPIHFPDGIGRGTVVAQLFRYRDRVRLDVELVHTRMLAKPDGTPSDRRSFLNDFVATVSVAAGARELPPAFERRVVTGVAAARDAVQRHNRQHTTPWNQLRIVAAASEREAAGAPSR